MAVLIARAPARLDFGGGWTDVPPYSEERGGCVCNVAIELHAVATVRSRDGNAKSDDDLALSPDTGLALAAMRRSGMQDVRVDVAAEYPVGAGLGGSSAAGVAVLGALAAWRGEELSAGDLAEESRRLEVEDLHIAGGRQDHYAAAMGGALGLWFTDRVTTRRIALSGVTIDALQSRCIVAYTGQSRISSDTITAVVDAYRRRDRRVLDTLDRMRDLANAMIQALESGDVDDLGHLVHEHWSYQRSLHPAIPTPAIDAILADAWEAGARGGKALGASGGGCVLAIAAEGREDDVRRAMARHAQPVPVRIARHGFEVITRSEPAPTSATGGAI
jgi:D-glycero-alpha-D-manno-heptose-7-phosphate kinase